MHFVLFWCPIQQQQVPVPFVGYPCVAARKQESSLFRLLALHGNPPVWWVGQFIWYLMRYQDEFRKDLDTSGRRLNFTPPCVGIHVRRTDKVGSEAAFHALDEYMQFVEAWFKIEAIKNGTTTVSEFNSMTKRVYLATDEPTLFAEARRTYPTYTFIGDVQVANTAQLSSRYSDSSLRGVVADIHFLSRCDYLVCTFSSQVSAGFESW